MKPYDFGGWATKNNLQCSDGLVIMPDAFKHNDGTKVPLVWNHQHNDPLNVLGHAILENRKEGVYAYCSFNESEGGEAAKTLVHNEDISSLSIYANKLKKDQNKVLHGSIREVSLVLAGANPGAYIDEILLHGEDSDEMILFTGENITLKHAEEKEESTNDKETIQDVFDTLSEKQKNAVYAMINQIANESIKQSDLNNNDMEEQEVLQHAEEKTIADVFETLNEEQKNAVYAIVGEIMNEDGDEQDMKQNVFDKDTKENTIMHADMTTILNDAKRTGSLRDAVYNQGFTEEDLKHAVTDAGGNEVGYGIANVDYLFPDARMVNPIPDFISRDMEWVNKVLSGAKHLPFSRVKSVHANIEMDEARAKGYVKGNTKTEEVFSLLKRVTSPTTIYKKQKMDRDDILDITGFDVVMWLKAEMRLMLNEELARAALVGDGRTVGTEDKINSECIRPIWTDHELYTVKKSIIMPANSTDDDRAKAFIRSAVKSRKEYKGSGNPTLFTTEDMLTDCLLMEDGNGRVIYETMDKLKTALRVRDIVTVPVMEGLSRAGTGSDTGSTMNLLGIIVNMTDYGFGADKGGKVGMFDDFDLNVNQQLYLIETRCSGALMKPYSAIVIEQKVTA